jgi:hypothetical protein
MKAGEYSCGAVLFFYMIFVKMSPMNPRNSVAATYVAGVTSSIRIS